MGFQQNRTPLDRDALLDPQMFVQTLPADRGESFSNAR